MKRKERPVKKTKAFKRSTDEYYIAEQGLKRLACGIVYQAVKDWKEGDEVTKKECEKFLTDFSGLSRYVIQRLKKGDIDDIRIFEDSF